MARTICGNPDFLAGHSRLPRQVQGLDGAPEWPAIRAMLPDVTGRCVAHSRLKVADLCARGASCGRPPVPAAWDFAAVAQSQQKADQPVVETLADHTGATAGGDRIGLEIAGDQGRRSDHRADPYPDAGHDDRLGPDPDIIADYGIACLRMTVCGVGKGGHLG